MLILDEHDGSRTATCLSLRAAGFVCATANDGAGALSLLDSFQPQAVVYEFSFRSGALIGFARTLRERAGYPLLIVAASVLDEPPEFCRRESVDAYFTKPFAMRDLKAALKRRPSAS
ncbi:MAG: hypothetical protein QM831_43970 [Kofleriaceae bacterium]